MDTYDIYVEDTGRYVARNLLSKGEALTLSNALALEGRRVQTFLTAAGTNTRSVIAHHLGGVTHLHNHYYNH